MLWKNYKFPIVSIAISGPVFYFVITHPLLSLILSLVTIGSIYGIIFAIYQSKPYTIVHNGKLKPRSNIVKWIIEQIQIPSKKNFKEIASKNTTPRAELQAIIDEICDLLLQDVVLSWYKDISNEQATLVQTFKEEIHQIVANVKKRCASADWVSILSNHLVVQFTQHYHQVRQSTLRPQTNPFHLPLYLALEDNETKFLQTLSESFIYLLLPSAYSSTLGIKYLLREIFVFRVFKPTINLICDPEYFNENILLRIEQLNSNNEQKLRKFTLASSYEKFIELIETSNDRDKLEQIWNYIATEIMQATVIKNLLKEGVVSKDNQQARLGTKGELLINRDLTKYINQLRCAKIVCERNMTVHGGRSYLLVDANANQNTLAHRKILSLDMILSSITGRLHLHQFLETLGTHALIKFWYDIWKLREAPSNERHRVATNIYKLYITSFGSAVRDEIDNPTVSQMERFLVGEQPEPDAFYHAQTLVYSVLKQDYYASFLVSKQYDALCRVFNPANLEDLDLKGQLLGWSSSICSTENFSKNHENHGLSSPEGLTEEASESVPKRLADLRSRLENKRYALLAAQEASTFQKNVLESLTNDCIKLQQEIVVLERLLENVDRWWSFLGQWRVFIIGYEFERTPFCLTIKIQPPDLQESQNSWFVTQTLQAWQHFYGRLRELQSSLPLIDAFRSRHQTFNSLRHDTVLSKQLMHQLETFLQTILQNEHLSSYEFVYQFLNRPLIENDSESPDTTSSKKKLVNLSKLFRSDKLINELSETDSLSFIEGRADSIAKPFYAFIDILFDEQGSLLKLIRMTLVQFIRVTYGSTINRQVRQSIVSLFQEERVVSYLTVLRDSLWPKTPPVERPARTDEEKIERRQQAKRQLLANIPETISLIFGSDNARLGAERLFELFQDIRLNKHLFYKILILVLNEIFPELQLKQSN